MKRISLITIGVLLVFAVATGLVLLSGHREMERSRKIEDEVARLREEADRIRGENRMLSEKIAFFSTESFEEREAKEKLGMKRSDEELVSVETDEVPTGIAEEPESEVSAVRIGVPNYRKWLALFGIADIE